MINLSHVDTGSDHVVHHHVSGKRWRHHRNQADDVLRVTYWFAICERVVLFQSRGNILSYASHRRILWSRNTERQELCHVRVHTQSPFLPPLLLSWWWHRHGYQIELNRCSWKQSGSAISPPHCEDISTHYSKNIQPIILYCQRWLHSDHFHSNPPSINSRGL